MTQIKTFYHNIDGRTIAYSSETEFLVQTGKGKKSSYKTKAKFRGNLEQAAMHYNGINLGPGHKKRLMMSGCSKPVLAKAYG